LIPREKQGVDRHDGCVRYAKPAGCSAMDEESPAIELDHPGPAGVVTMA